MLSRLGPVVRILLTSGIVMTGIATACAAERIPVLYSTDLYHRPHVDLDDHFDLAQLFALPELDVQGIILDINGQLGRSGRPAVDQMMALAGRQVRCAVGLRDPLGWPQDQALGQPPEFQQGVQLILDVLRRAERPLPMVLTGSVRDLVAALNRQPELLRSKLSAVYVNAGHAENVFDEYNVRLDAHAYRALFQSGLPITWCPCFPQTHANATYWEFDWQPLFAPGAVPLALRNYFVYAMEQLDPKRVPPLGILAPDFHPSSSNRAPHPKQMWCTPSLLSVARRKVYRVGPHDWVAAASAPPGAQEESLYRFVPARIHLGDPGQPAHVELGVAAQQANVKVFERPDVKSYGEAMNRCLMRLYQKLRITENPPAGEESDGLTPQASSATIR